MATLGITCPPLPGHLNPMLVMGAELQARGHRVVVLNVADAGDRVRAKGLEFGLLGETDFPPGSLTTWQQALPKRSQSSAVRSTAALLANIARVVLRDSAELISGLGIEGLIVDQAEYGGSTVAEALSLPYVTVANGFHLNREPGVPSAYTSWLPNSGWAARIRDRTVYTIEEYMYGLFLGRGVNQRRAQLGLRPYRWERECYSPLAQLSQCPRALDYPRSQLPAVWHGVGPLRADTESEPGFPFEQLDGRPLVYASLGSLQGNRRSVFAAIAAACAPLGVQLVITHGHQLAVEETTGFAGDPLVVPYAPQRALLARASLVVTHAGMNTVLDALSAGVPMVAIPLTFEQPAIAARLAWHGAGEVVPPRRASAARIRRAVARVLGATHYRESAQRLSRAIAAEGGVGRAADVVEAAIRTRRPVPSSGVTSSQ